MDKSRKVPEDLMGTILSEIAGPPGGERDSLEPVEPGAVPPAGGDEGAISWEDQPWLVGTTFNLSKQVGRELDRLRHDLQRQEGIHTSNSEITEVTLRIAIEDAGKRERAGQEACQRNGRPSRLSGWRGRPGNPAQRRCGRTHPRDDLQRRRGGSRRGGGRRCHRPACGDGIRGRAGEAPEPGEGRAGEHLRVGYG